MRWTSRPLALALVALLLSACRDKAPKATADPTPSSTATAPPPDPGHVNKAIVDTNRIVIPRTGNDPIVLELPVVSGLRDAAMNAKVDALLTPQLILGESLDEVRAEAKKVTGPGDLLMGVQGASTTVPFNDFGILELSVVVEFNGAYPSSNAFHAVVD